ncbi:MAG: TraR/DksA C4-type zinc finger protein [Planctomycetes bacterium]|nr:TraR/DksA C4-type zinc finger protein [Planctomycetota bacterium]
MAKKAAKKSVKKTAKTSAKKSSKKPVKKSAAKKPAAKKSGTKKSAGKSSKKPAAKPAKKTAGKSSGKTAAKPKSARKKSAAKSDGKKAGVARTAKRVSNKGVLISLKRSGPAPAPAPAAREKLRHVNATEKSKGQNPITLHHRKPTKKEAEEFRELLVARRKMLQGDVNDLQNEAFSDETQHVSSNHLADSSFEQYEQEFNLSMIENETEELKEIARALDKITQGTFGECEACGIDISIERLRAMPYTRICIHCRTKYEEEGGGEVYGVHPERRV